MSNKHRKTRRFFWTKPTIITEAKKYTKLSDFRKNSNGAYAAALRLGISDQVFKHFVPAQKPPGYWNLERIKKEAKKYKTRSDFRNSSNGAYAAAIRFGILDDVCKHMKQFSKPVGYWTEGNIRKFAAKCKTRSEFIEKSSAAYMHAKKLGILDSVCSHMISKYKPYGYWSKERLKKEAKKYKTRSVFARDSKAAYMAALKMGILTDICSHMKYLQKPNNYWNKTRIKEVAKKCRTRKEFYTKYRTAYQKAIVRGWLEDFCSHMKTPTSDKKRAIYAFEFPDRSVYVGLTSNYDNRYNHHMSKNLLLIKKTDELGHEFIMFNVFHTPHLARKAEAQKIEYYRRRGWKILNRAKAGALGSKTYWTISRLYKEAAKYDSKSKFLEKSSGAYSAAQKQGVINKICKHMTGLRRPNGYWTKKRVVAIARKYRTRVDFKKGDPAAYSAAQRLNILEESCRHMKSDRKPDGYWTEESVRREAKNHKTRSAFHEKASRACAVAKELGIYEEVCSHMASKTRPNGYWTEKRIRTEAKKYKTRSEFRRKCYPAYRAAHRRGLMDRVCSHMS